MCHKKIADKFICTSCVPLNVLPPVLRLLLVCSYPSVFAVSLVAVLSFLQSLCVMFHYSKGIPSAWHELKYFWSWESFRWMCYSHRVYSQMHRANRIIYVLCCKMQRAKRQCWCFWVANGRSCLVSIYLCFKLHMKGNHESGRREFLSRYHWFLLNGFKEIS